jgi:hypothetical protein
MNRSMLKKFSWSDSKQTLLLDRMNFWNVRDCSWRIENCARNMRMNSSIATKVFVKWFVTNTIFVIGTNLWKVCDCLWCIANCVRNVQKNTSIATDHFEWWYETNTTFVSCLLYLLNVRASSWWIVNCARKVRIDSSFAKKNFMKWFATNTIFVIGTNLLKACDN